ncbi:uncharacterized protein [Hetaerina americana]|uniref:uncharacterized protein n=1 Tax=Hetaerina americana TaxID=62018 RepID=UPI003A7F427C
MAGHEMSDVHLRHAIRQGQCNENEDLQTSTIIEVKTAFKGRLKTYWLSGGDKRSDLASFLKSHQNVVTQKIKEEVSICPVKINLLVKVKFSKKEELVDRWYKTKNVRVLQTDDVDDVVVELSDKLLREKSEHEGKGSGWTFTEILGLELRINRYTPLRGSSYFELPEKIRRTHSVINVGNYDDYCFKYAIWAKNIEQNPQRVAKYLTEQCCSGYDWNCVEYPVELENIPKFEKKNNISINVFGLDEKNNVFPLKVVDRELDDHRDLLYLVGENTTHYCWIKNFNKLVGSQYSKHKHGVYVCKRCFSHFSLNEKLNEHHKDCILNFPSEIILPTDDDKWLQFTNFSNTTRVPFVVYADFECMLTKVEPLDNHSNTKACQKHEVISFCMLLVSSSGNMFEPELYRGPEAVQVFLQKLRETSLYVQGIYNNKTPITMTQEDISNFETARTCHICGKDLDSVPVRDHDHVSGKFRGAAHKSCNANFQAPNFLPVFIHNLSNYDAHLIVPYLGYDDQETKCIPNTEERYISVSKHVNANFSYRFLDSFRFLGAPLSKLVSALPREKFLHTSRFFSENLDLVTRKGVFPYEYVDSLSKLNEPFLPPKETFFSSLTGETVSDSDYAFAQSVWTKLGCRTLGNYCDHYLKTDVLLLADVFQNFREICMTAYKLDPAWYFTTPGLAFDAMLKHTGVTLELMTDIDMILMMERGIRGGMSQCVKRYCEANNKSLEHYDHTKESTYIMYLDANNLYGWALSSPLPRGGFQWSEYKDVMNIPDDSPKGYILEVDLEYPQELHDSHSELPLCPEKKTPPNGKHVKLLNTLDNKKRYVLHYRNLKQALVKGLKMKYVHRVLEFDQSCWMKSYIDLNSQRRKLATDESERDFYKLMCNAVFGKTIENMRNRMKLELVSNPKRLDKLVAGPHFLDRTIYGENLAGVHLRQKAIKMYKPIYIGQTVLDVAKVFMYDFYYDQLKAEYDGKVSLLYMDTDSYIIEVKTKDFYADMKKKLSLYDTSNYPHCHPCFTQQNEKVVGKMKDECEGKPMTHFVGLRSKLYSYRIQGANEGKRAKGVKKSTIDKSLTFEDYRACLEEKAPAYRKMRLIKSKDHQLHTMEINKLALSHDDDKRFIDEGGIETLAWGHYKINSRKRKVSDE